MAYYFKHPAHCLCLCNTASCKTISVCQIVLLTSCNSSVMIRDDDRNITMMLENKPSSSFFLFFAYPLPCYICCLAAVPWLKRLISGFSPRLPSSIPVGVWTEYYVFKHSLLCQPIIRTDIRVAPTVDNRNNLM